MYDNFHVCVWSQKASETVSEVVNFKIFLGGMPQTSLASVRYRTLEFPPSTKKSCINPWQVHIVKMIKSQVILCHHAASNSVSFYMYMYYNRVKINNYLFMVFGSFHRSAITIPDTALIRVVLAWDSVLIFLLIFRKGGGEWILLLIKGML
jgi:hypothetical protein